MGRVSDFNGMNTCDENDFNQANSNLITTDNFLDSLNEHFMPIYNSFPDDIYRHPNLYASSNLSFMNPDDDRNEYFDEPLELDLLLDSASLNFDFVNSDSNAPQALQNDSPHGTDAETSTCEGNGNVSHIKQDIKPEVSDVQISESVSHYDVNLLENNSCVDNFEFTDDNAETSYTAEPIFKKSESSDENGDEIPKLIIRLKPESKCTEQVFSSTEDTAPLTIADNVKLGRRRSKNSKHNDTEEKTSKTIKKQKSHKHKSKHKDKKKHSSVKVKSKMTKINGTLNGKLLNYHTVSSPEEHRLLNENTGISTEIKDSETSINSLDQQNDLSSLLSDDDDDIDVICFKNSPSANKDLFSCNNNKVVVYDSEMKPVINENYETNDQASEESADVDSLDSFQFDFGNANDLSVSSSDIKIEDNESDDNFVVDINISVNDENIPKKNKSLQKDSKSMKTVETSKNTLCYAIPKEEVYKAENNDKNGLNKANSVSDLIEELNAHNQQVFEEIETSMSGFELEQIDAKGSTDVQHQTSHQSENSANIYAIKIETKPLSKVWENDTNSQNNLSHTKTSVTAQNISSLHPIANQVNTARPRNFSSSSSSVTSKSSTSHRSYRKRRRSSSSSSSSSDVDKFYNRPVKYDPVTQTYCDEFGRAIRSNELKFYLNAKSRIHDSHSNNGSSSSSRSKSPRYRSYHRKHRKSRSNSKSYRRKRYSSSRSRSRSHSRRYRGESNRRYKSPSPKHRSKGHYLDIEENMRAYEERRVMYVGDIPPDYTVEQLKERFSRFGPIQTASIKSKITADGSLYIFGFVTFKNRSDVCQAIERGNDNPSWPRFDLNFGGRRRFCNGNYTDLDGKVAETESGWYGHYSSYRQQQPPKQEDDFAELLRMEQKRLGMAKK